MADIMETITGTEKADKIYVNDDNRLVQALGEDDSISNYGKNVIIEGGAGKDSIRNYGATVTINGDAGNDLIYNDSVASYVTISGGADNDSIRNYGTNVVINGNDGKDTIRNYASNVTIDGGAGKNIIVNSGASVSIGNSDGNNSVSNSGSYVIITGNANNDSVTTGGEHVTINTGDGKDYIYSTSLASFAIIDAGAGDDSTSIRGTDIFLNVGAGNDSVRNYGNKVTVIGGDGDDTIYTGGEYATITGDADNDHIYATSLASYATIDGGIGDDIISVSGSNISVNGGDGNDTVSDYGTNATIDASTGDDIISVSGSNTYVDGGEGNDSIYSDTVASAVTIDAGAGDDYVESSGSNITINGGEGADTVRNSGFNVKIDSGAGNDSIYNGSATTYVTINGGEGADTVRNYGANVSISGGSGNDIIQNSASANVTVNGGKGNDSIKNISSPNVFFEYAVGDGKDTIYGFDTTATLKIGNGNDTYTKAVKGANLILTVGDGSVLLKNAASLSSVNILGKEVTLSPAWTLNGRTATYGITGSNPIITVSGVKSLDGISLDGSTVTVADSALEQKPVTINKGYVLKLGEDVTTKDSIPGGWLLNGTSAIYTADMTTAGYVLDNNQISYALESGGATFTVNGVQSANGLTLNSKAIMVSNAALNQTSVTVSDNNYTLVLADDVPLSTSVKASWELIAENAIYTGEATTAGYSLINNNISYTAGEGGETFTVSGVKSLDGLSVNDTIVTVANAALNQKDITISAGYSLALGSDVEEIKIKSGWLNLSNGNIAYQSNSTMAGYKLEDNQISYVDSLEGETLIEFSGISSSSTLDILDESIVLAAQDFASDVAAVQGVIHNFELAMDDYNDKKFTGTEKVDTINNHGSYIAINGGAGSDKINSTGYKVTISGGTGDDLVTVSGDAGANNTYVYTSGDGDDILYNFRRSDTLQVLGATDIAEKVDGNDVIFTVDKGTITLKDAAAADMTITLVNAKEIISANRYTTAGIVRGNTIELSETLKRAYRQEDNISVVDGSKVKGGAQIEGSGAGGTLLGGNGNDTLTSGRNNFELTGGKGNDTFIYSGGANVITDYSQKGSLGADKIRIDGIFNTESYSIEGNDVVLSFGNDNVLTIKNGKDKEITFAGQKSPVKIYTDEGVFDGKKKFFELASSADGSFSAAKYSKMITIDGSNVSSAVNLIGNKKANYILAGSGGATLNGGKGKDTLIGGAGKDIFIYDKKSGNKVIQNYNYAQGDAISLQSGVSVSQFTAKKNGVAIKAGSNTITIDSNIFSFTENDATKIYDNGKVMTSDGKSVTLSADAKGKFEVGSGNYRDCSNMSAELASKAVKLIGDTNDNSLTGGKGKDTLDGGNNADTLNGGKGDDSLWGGGGADTFVYYAGEGNDTIGDYNYDDGDLLSIFDKKGKAISNPISDATSNNKDWTLSIKGGGKLVLKNIGQRLTVNANGKEYSF